MDLETFLNGLNSGRPVKGGGEVHQFMHGVSQEALRITAEINSGYHTPEELRALFSRLTGQPVDESFGMFPPFYTDCGKNIHVGKNVFLNMGCKLQDQGGIFIGDGAPHRPQRGAGHPQPRHVPQGPEQHGPRAHPNRKKRVDRSQRHRAARRDHWRRGHRGRRGRGHKGCTGEHRCGRRARQSYTHHQRGG